MSLTMTRADDWHLHLRDGPALGCTVPHAARQFERAIIMPNLHPPVTSVPAALAYRQRILANVPRGETFDPLMTLYLTDHTTTADISAALASQRIFGCKLYPAGATTNSAAGVTRLENLDPVFSAMTESRLPLLIHGEVVDPQVDIFDREAEFITRHLVPLRRRHPDLRLVLEHLTTAEGVAFVQEAPDHVGATITPHHLLLSRSDIFRGGINPHLYCLPILKRERHRQALLAAATGGNGKFFLGTDSAPHPRSGKETACGCAGIYSAHAALELYATAFEQAGALEQLEGFSSFYGPDFYGLPRNAGTVTLERRSWDVPAKYEFGSEELIPLLAGQKLEWQLQRS